MNNKILTIIAPITSILLFIGAVGYFAFVSKPKLISEATESAPTSTSTSESTPTPSPNEPMESPGPPKSLPPQGLYDDSDPSTAESRSRLDKFAKAGFKLVINYGVFDYEVADIIDYANHAAAVGMKVIWDMSSPPYRDGTFDRNYIRERVNSVKAHPATWGYYIADEPDKKEQRQVKTLSDYVYKLDSAHPRFLVHYYQSADPTVLLRPHVNAADVIGLDVYALQAGQPSEDVGESAKAGQKLADEESKQLSIVLQSFDAAQYKEELQEYANPGWPDRKRMIKERNLALENSNPAFILWYSYFDILKSSDPAGHWADLVTAAFSPTPAFMCKPIPLPIGESVPTPPPVTSHSKNAIRSIRSVPSGVEIEVTSGKKFPVRNELVVLRIGAQEFRLSRYPESGDTHTLIFTLTPEEFAKTATGDSVMCSTVRATCPVKSGGILAH